MPDENTVRFACAQAAHEANRAYCRAIGDPENPPWAEAPDWMVSSSLQGVGSVLAGGTPQEQHESWMASRLTDGWKLGPVKDTEKKEHPCLVPYAELPPAQRAKDALFIDTVLAMARALGWGVAP